MEQRTTYPRRRSGTGADWRSYLWIMCSVAGVVGTGTPVAYAASTTREVAQRRGPDATLLFFGCTGLAILILAILIRLFHQRFAPRYNRQLVSTRSIDEVLALIGELFPARDVVGRPWVWKRSPSDPQVLELSAYPLPYWAGCLIMLVTGIIWGFVAWVILGRRERVTIRLATAGEGVSIQIHALGNAATAKAQILAARLGGAQPLF
ncbi:MAG TPA: hypothetical protein VGJ87_03150 [Roseiflexaceae bacterium]|jgi:hypothetical protein